MAGTGAGGGSGADAVSIREEMDANSTKLAAILADTNELQTDWVNGGRLDTLLDTQFAAILLDTNELQTDWTNGGRLDLLLDSQLAELAKIPRASAAIGAGAFVMTITGGQAAPVTYTAPA
jgi:hypothetical protein